MGGKMFAVSLSYKSFGGKLLLKDLLTFQNFQLSDEKVLPPNPQISLQQVTRRTLFNSLLNGKQELLFLGPCFVPLFCDSSKTIKSRVLIVYLLL